MKRKLLFRSLLPLLLVSLLCILPARAESGTCGENLTWTLDAEGTLTISGTGAIEDYAGSKSAWPRYPIQSVVIESGVTSIGKYAFRSCTMETISIPSTVTEIGMSAFESCKKLKGAVIPAGVAVLDAAQFRNCSGLEMLMTAEDTEVGLSLLKGCTMLADEKGFLIYRGILYDYTGYETSLVIPEGVTAVGASALNGKNLTEISLPESLTRIGDAAFSNARELKSITLPDGVRELGNLAFSGCSGLEEVSLPGGLTAIGANAFYECSRLKSPVLPETVTFIGGSAFYGCSQLQSLVIPKGVTSIGERTFYRCTALETVTLRGSVTEIGASAFEGCGSLRSMNFPEGLLSIGERAFYQCECLPLVRLPDSVGSVGDAAFYECSGLTEFIWKGAGGTTDTVSMGAQALCMCTGLQKAVLPAALTRIENAVFSGCSNLLSFDCPAAVTQIGEKAFYNCTGLREVTLPSGLKRITNSAFQNCGSLAGVRLPNGLEYIGKEAFSGCSSLTDISIPASVVTVSQGAFSGCTGLTRAADWRSGGYIYAIFGGCTGLKSVLLLDPQSIDSSAFSSCTALEDVYYGGTEEEWKRWRLDRAFSAVSPTVHYHILEDAEAQVRKDTDSFVRAYENYLSKVAREVRKLAEEAREETETGFSDQARAMRESGRFYVNSLDLSGLAVPEDVELCAYEALCRVLSEAGENSGVDLSGIRGDSIPVSTVSAVAKAVTAYSSSKELDTTVQTGLLRSRATADIQIGSYVGGFLGRITVTTAATGQKHAFSVVSSTSELRGAVTAYFEELMKLGNAAVENVYDAFIGSVIEAPLASLTEQLISARLTPLLQSKLEEKGISHLADTLNACVKSYQQGSRLMGLLHKLDLASMPDAAAILSDSRLTDPDFGSWTGSFAKGLSRKLAAAQAKLIQDWVLLAAGDFSFVEAQGGTLKKVLSVFHCPISVTVSDETGAVIGYVGEDDLWYSDAIEIEEQGDAKLIRSEAGAKLSFAVTGTDDGTVSCSFRDLSEEASGGRINYYDLPVREGTSILVTLENGRTASPEDVTLTREGEAAPAAEFIESPAAGAVRVLCTGENGTVLGAGSYVKGDLATLAALPDEGFRFGGWYDGDGRLVSVNEVYSFVVQGDTELRPEFFAPRAYLPESLSAVLSDSVLTYEVTASEPERERLVIARYDAGGRMAGLELREAADGSLPAEPGCTWRLFLVDGAWVPLTEAVIPGSAPAEP